MSNLNKTMNNKHVETELKSNKSSLTEITSVYFKLDTIIILGGKVVGLFIYLFVW